jgi:2-polyprenyl-3-methyl-5-hydroxy-6-metoxy-1,4-benzoquinol methylase
MVEALVNNNVGPPLGCPVCNSQNYKSLYPEYQGRCITSQMFFLDQIKIENRCCTDCGFIFNQGGVRGREEEIYNQQVWKPKPQVVSYSKNVMTTHQRALAVFQKIVAIPEKGSLLDFGAGTGAFLQHFSQAYPKWELTAIEPGDGFNQMSASLPLKYAYNKPYYLLEIAEQFDLAIVMSVLEHVSDPAGALQWLHRVIKPGGLLIMQHPNFALLPGDLFCADHINKFTPVYTRKLCEFSGFDFMSEDATMVSFYQAYIKTNITNQRIPRLTEENLAIARQSEHIARQTVSAVEKAVRVAASKGHSAAVFGTSPIGSMAPLILGCKDSIACFVDENQNMWDRNIDGIPVVGPDRMRELGVTDVGIAISPLYWDTVAEKLKKYGVETHVPQIRGLEARL